MVPWYDPVEAPDSSQWRVCVDSLNGPKEVTDGPLWSLVEISVKNSVMVLLEVPWWSSLVISEWSLVLVGSFEGPPIVHTVVLCPLCAGSIVVVPCGSTEKEVTLARSLLIAHT